jgi:integrase/recombinase XerD
MSPRFQKKAARNLAFQQVKDAYLDFMLSRQAKSCTPQTLFHYNKVKEFLLWTEGEGVTSLPDLQARHVRKFLAILNEQGKADTTCHGYARAIKTFVRFLFAEHLIPYEIKFDMPKLQKKRLPVLTGEQLRLIVSRCNVRDKAIVLLMADTGLRASEVCHLNWGDLNMENGLVRVRQGKGQKDRSVVCGAVTRRAVLNYRRSLKNWNDEAPMFQANYNYRNARLGRTGLLLIYQRLSKETNIHVTPHAMRRTFVLLSLRRHMDVGHIQAMLGHTTLDMVYHYAQLEDEDLLREHHERGPVDDLF